MNYTDIAIKTFKRADVAYYCSPDVTTEDQFDKLAAPSSYADAADEAISYRSVSDVVDPGLDGIERMIWFILLVGAAEGEL